MNRQIEIIRSKRNTVSLEIKQDGRIILRAPARMKDGDIQRFIKEKSSWLEKHLKKLKQNNEDAPAPLNDEEFKSLLNEAKIYIPKRVAEISQAVGVNYNRITIRSQHTRFGSCSSKGNLNFNCVLMLFPREVLDYVIIHELCHIRYMNHSKLFWAEVERYCPDYKTHRKWLKENGGHFINKMGTR